MVRPASSWRAAPAHQPRCAIASAPCWCPDEGHRRTAPHRGAGRQPPERGGAPRGSSSSTTLQRQPGRRRRSLVALAAVEPRGAGRGARAWSELGREQARARRIATPPRACHRPGRRRSDEPARTVCRRGGAATHHGSQPHEAVHGSDPPRIGDAVLYENDSGPLPRHPRSGRTTLGPPKALLGHRFRRPRHFRRALARTRLSVPPACRPLAPARLSPRRVRPLLVEARRVVRGRPPRGDRLRRGRPEGGGSPGARHRCRRRSWPPAAASPSKPIELSARSSAATGPREDARSRATRPGRDRLHRPHPPGAAIGMTNWPRGRDGPPPACRSRAHRPHRVDHRRGLRRPLHRQPRFGGSSIGIA